ncbi:Gfo/Idh/MocA family oxidoreductase [Pontiellaceae bacterium B1224]|nr:Gfo/Idh/MocA family oxidoreductase [Pontiellaceae bacterium B1224]
MNISRRYTLGAAGALAGWSLIPGKVLGANKKVNLAAIGIGPQGGNILKIFAQDPNVNIVALCDVDIDSDSPIAKLPDYRDQGWGNADATPAAHAALFPGVPQFHDFREMFDQMSNQIDAVCIGVPDHSHFPIAMASMMLGKHVYVEKPLARTFQECELLMKAEKKYGVVTQMGNQGHSGNNYFQFKAWKDAGIIKDVTHVDAQMNNPRRWHTWGEVTGFPTGGVIPDGMNWNVWEGTTPISVEFSKKLHYGNWRGWHQFGTGCFGDWGAHILDTIHEFLELGLPSTFSAEMMTGRNDFIFPMTSTINFKFPARKGMPAMDINWYDGQGNAAPVPKGAEGEKLKGPGKYIYSKDYTFMGGSHSDTLQIVPYEKMRELLKEGKLPKVSAKGKSTHHENFIRACMGEEKTRSPFSVSGTLSQMFTLGCMAQRLGGSFEFDRETKQITNNKLANSLLKDDVRNGWEQYYKV